MNAREAMLEALRRAYQRRGYEEEQDLLNGLADAALAAGGRDREEERLWLERVLMPAERGAIQMILQRYCGGPAPAEARSPDPDPDPASACRWCGSENHCNFCDPAWTCSVPGPDGVTERMHHGPTPRGAIDNARAHPSPGGEEKS